VPYLNAHVTFGVASARPGTLKPGQNSRFRTVNHLENAC